MTHAVDIGYIKEKSLPELKKAGVPVPSPLVTRAYPPRANTDFMSKDPTKGQ
jgi:hypothetical protein